MHRSRRQGRIGWESGYSFELDQRRAVCVYRASQIAPRGPEIGLCFEHLELDANAIDVAIPCDLEDARNGASEPTREHRVHRSSLAESVELPEAEANAGGGDDESERQEREGSTAHGVGPGRVRTHESYVPGGGGPITKRDAPGLTGPGPSTVHSSAWFARSERRERRDHP